MSNPPGWDPTPSSLSAIIQFLGAFAQLEMYKDMKERVKACAQEAEELACEIADKKCELMDLQPTLYEKLESVPDVPDCETDTMCAMEYNALMQTANLIEESLQNLDCYDVGVGREMVRAGLTVGAEAAMNAKVDGCKWEDGIQDARYMLQQNAIITSPMQGDGYAGLAHVYSTQGNNYMSRMAAHANAFEQSLAAFSFSMMSVFRNRRTNSDGQRQQNLPIESYAINDTPGSQGIPVPPPGSFNPYGGGLF